MPSQSWTVIPIDSPIVIKCDGGGRPTVNLHAFHSGDLSSNPTEKNVTFRIENKLWLL